LADRNKYLKQAAFNGFTDHLLLDSFDSLLASEGKPLLKKRAEFLKVYATTVLDLYQFISEGNESPFINYISASSSETLQKDIADARQKDMILQRTTVGPHRDDLELMLGDAPFKQVASQGQKKSMLFSLKLAEFSLLKKYFGFSPILLLDDIFEKLDQQRLEQLLDWVCIKNDGQVILTDTHEDRVHSSLSNKNVPFQLIKI
jgi:DNA replication and repair protein RecF